MKLLFDLGGTNIRVAVSRGKTLQRPVIAPAPRSYEGVLRVLCGEARRLSAGRSLTGISGGLAGTLDRGKTRLIQSTHLPYFVGKPFRRDLSRMLHAPFLLENDSALVALGEAQYGAGRGYSIVAYVGFGTGIGGARICDGRIDRNAFGFEPGHHFIDVTVRRHGHPSPHPGDWESFVSGSGVEYHYGTPAPRLKKARAWHELSRMAALGLINVSVFWSPDVLVVGGSLMKRLPVAEIKKDYRRFLKIFPQHPQIVKARLGDFGGLYGALALSQQKRT